MLENLDDIIAGCKAGKHAACEKLYNLYAGKMWALCRRYSPNYDSAKDVLQDGFIKVFEKIGQFEGRGHFEGWMRRVFVNMALANYRKTNHLSIDMVVLPENEDSGGVEFEIGAKELMEMVNELSPQYKMVFNLYAIEGYSHKEIAELLGISEGSSKSNLSRAREILKKKVLKYNNEELKIG